MLFLITISLTGLSTPRAYATDEKVVTLSVDGTRRGFTTDAKTVAEVLGRLGVVPAPDDLVEPSVDTAINTAVFYINIYRARPVVVRDGDHVVRVNSPYQNPKLIAEKSAGIKIYAEDSFSTTPIRDFVSLDTIGYEVTVHRAVPFTLSVEGKTFPARSSQATVGEMLTDKGITIGKRDQVVPGVGARLRRGMHVKVLRVGKKTKTVEEVIPFQIQNIFDNNKPVGYEQVRQEGVNGRQLVTYEITFHNGKEAKRKIVEKVIQSRPVTKIVVRGEPQSAGGVWAALRACESGGNYATNTGNGFYGAYQFDYSTWRSNAPGQWANSYPYQAPPSAQDAAAQNLQSRRGWYPWPACARKLGLI